MHPQIETIFDEAEHRYLKPEELGVINQYVNSLPERLDTYRMLRDRELEIMQQVADQLEAALPNETVENLERSLKNALLLLRYSAMGMLLNDEAFVQSRLLSWLMTTISIHNTQAIDTALFPLAESASDASAHGEADQSGRPIHCQSASCNPASTNACCCWPLNMYGSLNFF